MATHFSETLQRLRKAAGFPTAYRFFHDNGGDKVLGMCYRKYLMMEQGRILPLFKHLRAFLFGLRVVPNSADSRELVSAWLRTMAGDPYFDELLNPLLTAAPAGPGLSPMDKAMKATMNSRRYYLKPAQLEAISAAPENFRCFLSLSNDTGSWTPEALAPQIGLTAASAKKGLEALAGAKLLKKARGAYRCPYHSVPIEFPHMNSGFRDAYERIARYRQELLESGRKVWFRWGFLRSDADMLANFFPVLAAGVDSAAGCSVTSKNSRSGLYAVETKVVKLLDF